MAWEYEPVEFVLEKDRQGNPRAAFRPDFYLPAYDLFIEITTLNQKLVTKKNRKVRRLAELHPDVDVKILYQRDYQALLVKYGLEGGGSSSPEPRPAEPVAGPPVLRRLDGEPREPGRPAGARPENRRRPA